MFNKLLLKLSIVVIALLAMSATPANAEGSSDNGNGSACQPGSGAACCPK